MMMMMMITFCTPFVFISQHVIRGSLKKAKLRLLGPSRMDVCSVALGVGMVAHHHVFCGIFSLHVFTRGRL